MTKFIIIDGDNVSRFNARWIEAWNIDAIHPLRIIRVAPVKEGEVLIYTDRKVSEVEDCLDPHCKHLRSVKGVANAKDVS